MPIQFSPRFSRRLAKKTPAQQDAILRCIQKLGQYPAAQGLRVKKMRGYENVWEARVDQGNRLTFERHGDTITLRVHCSHDVLRDP